MKKTHTVNEILKPIKVHTTIRVKKKKEKEKACNNTVKKSKFEILNSYTVSQGVKLNEIYFGNCIDRMNWLASNSVDFILSDPPYNQNANGEGWDNLTSEDFEQLLEEHLKQSFRVLKRNGAILCYGSQKSISIVGYLMQKIGFDIRATYVWLKPNGRPSIYGPKHSAEYIIWATKTKGVAYYDVEYAKQINDGKNIDIVIYENTAPKREKLFGKFYCQKPLKLTHRLIKLHTKPEDVILLPFCGSGSECVAAVQTNRNFIAFESKEQNFQHANKWLDDVRQRHSNTMINKFLITETVSID